MRMDHVSSMRLIAVGRKDRDCYHAAEAGIVGSPALNCVEEAVAVATPVMTADKIAYVTSVGMTWRAAVVRWIVCGTNEKAAT